MLHAFTHSIKEEVNFAAASINASLLSERYVQPAHVHAVCFGTSKARACTRASKQLNRTSQFKAMFIPRSNSHMRSSMRYGRGG